MPAPAKRERSPSSAATPAGWILPAPLIDPGMPAMTGRGPARMRRSASSIRAAAARISSTVWAMTNSSPRCAW
jgi:hypothetical protein